MRKLAIVTGAGRGIGRATAIKLAQDGYAVAVNYLNDAAAAQEVVDAIIALGGSAKLVQADVSKEADVVRMFEEAELLGDLKLLVNNAGVLQTQMRLQDMSLSRIKSIFETNVYGVILCCKQAALKMADHSGASIVNVSSVAAKTGSPNEYIDYAASKGAVDSVTVGLAKELAVRGIRVNGVRPGLIETDIHASGGEPNRVARIASSIPMGRGGAADEVANAIAWLACEQASYCTGVCLDVAGGL